MLIPPAWAKREVAAPERAKTNSTVLFISMRSLAVGGNYVHINLAYELRFYSTPIVGVFHELPVTSTLNISLLLTKIFLGRVSESVHLPKPNRSKQQVFGVVLKIAKGLKGFHGED